MVAGSAMRMKKRGYLITIRVYFYGGILKCIALDKLIFLSLSFPKKSFFKFV